MTKYMYMKKKKSMAELTKEAILDSIPKQPFSESQELTVLGPDENGRYFLNFVMPPQRIGRTIINRAALEKINISFWK